MSDDSDDYDNTDLDSDFSVNNNNVNNKNERNVGIDPPPSSWSSILTIRSVACSGLPTNELTLVLETIQKVIVDETGMIPVIDRHEHQAMVTSTSTSTTKVNLQRQQIHQNVLSKVNIPGITGRVLLVHVNIDDDSLDMIYTVVSELLDSYVHDHQQQQQQQNDGGADNDYKDLPTLHQPLLLKLQNNNDSSMESRFTSSSSSSFDDDADDNGYNNHDSIDIQSSILANIILQEIEEYGLRVPIGRTAQKVLVSENNNSYDDDDVRVVRPSLQIELDGAYLPNQMDDIDQDEDDNGDDQDNIHDDSSDDGALTRRQMKSTDTTSSWWDTSSVLVFDDLISNDLRKRLLNTVIWGKDSTTNDIENDHWDDNVNGPNPQRWERGGLIDIPDTDDDNENDSIQPPLPPPVSPRPLSWGLRPEVIDELCSTENDANSAIYEMEYIIAQKVFNSSHFTVCRLPEAVLGDCVSPLTANAPTASGEVFSYHIDGDPNYTPPSPWTDIYGRYPNRQKGKPRFMSFLLYLNDEWDEPSWGAPTRFLDVQTNTSIDVYPRPGRCVLMDQDITHTVVSPNGNVAGWNRPRYSLVWKLLIHPTPRTIPSQPTKTSWFDQLHPQQQDMKDLANGRDWEKPILFGSAATLASTGADDAVSLLSGG
jgi:hypothetical protein